ncbi:MAG TPA: cell division protein CrgA [Acidimicrobiales bacterium]|nr:cell division protein CrgA [Acidimicrobiales bacterium]
MTPSKESGRATPPKAKQSGRYTPPIPKTVRHSPSWYPYVLITLFVIGLAVIVINYAGVFWAASNIALVVGLALIVAGAFMATTYH